MTATLQGTGHPGHPAPHAGAVSLSALWYGVFGGPVAWAVQLIFNYALNAHFCYPADTPRVSPSFDGVRWLGIAASAVLLLVALGALWTAIHAWSKTRGEARQNQSNPDHHETAEIGEGRTRFMALSGMLVSGIFVFAVLMNGLPLITMPVCVY